MKKIILIISLMLLLSSCFWNKEKNTFVTENNNINQNNIVENTISEDIEIIPVTKDVKEMSLVELNNSMYWKNWWDNIKQKIETLNSTWASIVDKTKAVYLKSFVWDYENALKERWELCKTDKNLCKKVDINLTSYRPTDTEWNIIDNADIYINWEKVWNLKAKNTLNVYNNFIHRVKVSKKWYLDHYTKFWVSENWLDSESLNPKLLKANSMETVFSGTWIVKNTWNYTYTIEANSFTTLDWKSVVWNVDIYFFDIDWTEWNLNVFNLDAFDNETLSYMGWSMVTHGMPLIKAYKWDTELKIIKPISWKWLIINQEKMPWMDLNNVPKWVYLWKNELAKYNIPAFWWLDQQNWVWISSEMKILDNLWNYEFQLK